MRIYAEPHRPGDGAALLRRGLRRSDLVESYRATALPIEKSLSRCLTHSAMTATLRVDGRITGLLGVASRDLLGSVGLPWFVAHPEFEDPRVMVGAARLVRSFIEQWLTVFSTLENLTDPDHKQALRFLVWLGFNLDAVPVTGPLGHPLIRFWRKQPCA